MHPKTWESIGTDGSFLNGKVPCSPSKLTRFPFNIRSCTRIKCAIIRIPESCFLHPCQTGHTLQNSLKIHPVSVPDSNESKYYKITCVWYIWYLLGSLIRFASSWWRWRSPLSLWSPGDIYALMIWVYSRNTYATCTTNWNKVLALATCNLPCWYGRPNR